MLYLLKKRFFCNIALVRSPSTYLNNGIISYIEKTRVNYQIALKQWKEYCKVFEENNWKVLEIPPPTIENNHPDSVFIEDCTVIFKNKQINQNIAIITRPGHPNRISEINNIELFLQEFNIVKNIYKINEPGTLDGGDVLKIGNTVYVGLNNRTNIEGINQLRAILSPLNYEVISVPITTVLHLKTAITALPCGTALIYPPSLGGINNTKTNNIIEIFRTTGSKKILIVPEDNTQVIVLNDNHVLMSNKSPLTTEIFRKSPYNLKVTTVDIEEFIKLEGCVTCLSIRVRSN